MYAKSYGIFIPKNSTMAKILLRPMQALLKMKRGQRYTNLQEAKGVGRE